MSTVGYDVTNSGLAPPRLDSSPVRTGLESGRVLSCRLYCANYQTSRISALSPAQHKTMCQTMRQLKDWDLSQVYTTPHASHTLPHAQFWVMIVCVGYYSVCASKNKKRLHHPQQQVETTAKYQNGDNAEMLLFRQCPGRSDGGRNLHAGRCIFFVWASSITTGTTNDDVLVLLL